MINGFQNAFILTALSVYGSIAEEKSNNIKNYISGSFFSQLMLAIIISLLSFFLLLMSSGVINKILIGILSIQFFMQGQEFFRRLLMARFWFNKLIINDVITHLIRFVIISCYFYNNAIFLNIVYISIMAGYGFGLVIGFLQTQKLIQFRAFWQNSLFAIKKNWFYSKWIIGEIITYNLSTQLYIYITALYVNKEATGALGGIQSIYNIFNVLILAMANFALPLAAQKKHLKQYRSWRKLITKVSLLSIGIAIPIVVFSFLYPTIIIKLFLGNPVYINYYNLVFIFGFIALFRMCNSIFSIIFNSLELPELGFYSKFVSAIATLIIAYPLIRFLAVYGAAFGVMFTQIIWLSVYLYYIFFKKTKIIHAFK